MRKVHRIAVSLFLLLAALFAGLEYLNRVVLPAKARQWAEQAASQALGRPVTIGRLRVHLWHGFLLEDVSVLEDPGYGPGPLLEVEQISGGILFLPILRDRELIIPALHIVRPRLRLIQDPDGRWNLQQLFRQPPAKPALSKAEGPAARRKLGVLVPRIVLTGGEMEITPGGGPPATTLRLSDLQVEIGLFLPARVEWSGSADLRSDLSGPSAPPARLSLSGTYTPQKDSLQAAVEVSIPLGAVPPHLPQAAREALLSLEGSLTADLELAGQVKGPYSLKAWMETEGLSWETPQPFVSGWDAEPPDRLRGQGELRARIGGEIPALPATKPGYPPISGWAKEVPGVRQHERPTEPWRDLRGVLTLDGMSLGPVPYAGEIQRIAGDLAVDAQGIRAERITALLPSGLPLEFSGSVLNDPAATLGFRLKSSFPAEQLPPLPATWQALRAALRPGGRVEVEASGSGSMRPTLSLRPTATALLDDIALELPNGWPVRKLHGTLRAQPDLLTMTGIRGELREQPFTMAATLVNSAQPEINAELSWGNLSAQGQLALFSDKVEIHSLTGRLGQGPFRIIGEIGRPDPVANLLGEATAHLEELPSLWPMEPPAWLRDPPAKGEVSARVLVEGDLRRPAELLVDLKASAPALTLQEVPLRQVSVDLRQERGRVSLNAARAEIAQGTLYASGSLAAADPKRSWSGRLTATDVDMAALAEQLRWKTQEMSGKLQIQWEGRGEGTALSSLSGPGAIQIRGARILELPLLGRFADFLTLPSLKAIAFQEAQGPFELTQGQARTERFTLSAPQATLTVAGAGGFLQGLDSPIAWRVLPALTPELIPEESRSKIGAVIAKGASYLIGEVRVEGTWRNPRTRFVSRPLTEMLGDQLSNLEELLKDLF